MDIQAKNNILNKIEQLKRDKPQKKLFTKIVPLKRQFDKCQKYINIDPPEKDYRVIGFSDLHSPYILGDLLDRAIDIEMAKTHLPPIKYWVIVGDLNQFDEFSKFVRFDDQNLIYAIRQSRRVLRTLAHFAPVYWIHGNHDLRPHKRLYELLDPEVARIAEQFGVGLSFIDVIKYGLNNVHSVPFYLIRIDDVAFTHCFFASVIPGRAGAWSYDVISNYVDKGYLTKDVNCVAQAHTHGCTPGIQHRNKLCIETGCLCPDLDYALMKTSHFSKYKLFENGYASITVRDNKVDFTESRGIPLK